MIENQIKSKYLVFNLCIGMSALLVLLAQKLQQKKHKPERFTQLKVQAIHQLFGCFLTNSNRARRLSAAKAT